MKILLFISLLVLSIATNFGQSNIENAIASCCEEGRGCTGSAYCSACKNCSGCKHCSKNGGSCGVCNGGRSVRSYSSSKTKTSSTNQSSNFNNFSVEDKVLIISTTLNLREGPGTNYKIVKKLTINTLLIVIEKQGKWLKVKVDGTTTVGFVYDKYVRKS